jgi:ribosomal protein S18 acetylase RimI-like enzyme
MIIVKGFIALVYPVFFCGGLLACTEVTGVASLMVPSTAAQMSCSSESGAWTTTDKKGELVTVEIERINPGVAGIKERLLGLGDIYAQASYEPDMATLERFPSIYLLPEVWLLYVKMLFRGQTYQDFIKESFGKELDERLAATENTLYVATAKDVNHLVQGFVFFTIKPTYEPGSMYLSHLMINSSHQGRGLGKFLMSSIFNVRTDIKRLFLETSKANDKAITVYKNMGFVVSEESDYGVGFEYLPAQCDRLQLLARSLKPIVNLSGLA